MPISRMNPWVPTQYPFGLNGPDLTPYYWKIEMEELKKMGLTPGSPVAPPLITEEEAEALKKKILEKQQQRVKGSSTYQSRNRADHIRIVANCSHVQKAHVHFDKFFGTDSKLGAASSRKGTTSNANTSCWESEEDVKYILGQILLVLIGLLTAFFLLTEILKILKRLYR